jgi:hypothetical protein
MFPVWREEDGHVFACILTTAPARTMLACQDRARPIVLDQAIEEWSARLPTTYLSENAAS